MQTFTGNRGNLCCDREGTVTGKPIHTGTQKKTSACFFSLAEQLVDVAFTIADMHTALRVTEQMRRLIKVNATAAMHDTFQIRFEDGSWVRTAVNVPGMLVGGAITYPALMRGLPSVWSCSEP